MPRLVVRAPNWLGDAIMALPALGGVRRAFPADRLILAAPPSISPLFEERTDAAPDEILVLDRSRETEQLRAAHADTVLLLPNSFGSAWCASRSGISERWGYAAGARRWLLTRAVPRPHGVMHQTRYFLALVRGLDIEAADAPPRVEASSQSLRQADVLLGAAGFGPGRPLVGFAPGAAYGHAKQWPPKRFAVVAEALSTRGAAVVLVGAAADREAGRAIESALSRGARVANLIGRTNLRQLVGVVARCASFVSNDSGAMHLADALGVPLTAIFGPTNERATAPAGGGPADVLVRDVFCRPCMLHECPIDHRCMKRIAADDVIASVVAHTKW